MKKAVFALSLVVFSVMSYAQITAEILDPFVFEDVDVEGSANLSVSILVTNTSSDSIDVKWEIKRAEAICVENWEFIMCDVNQCYPPSISSNIDLDAPIDIPCVMPPNYSYEFTFNIQPNSTAGCCDLTIEFSLEEAQDDILVTIDLPIQINSATCTTATNDDLLPDLKIYPNPFENSMTIENGGGISSVKIYNVAGEIVNQQVVKNNTITELDELVKGMYTVTFHNEENEALKMVSVVKE